MAYSILLFFVCLNVSLYLVAETQVLPYYQPPYEKPGDIETKFFPRLEVGIEDVAIVGIGGVLSFITGNLLIGGGVILLLFGLSMLIPAFEWVFFGFPKFLQLMGVPDVIYTALIALMCVVWYWFLIGILSQRYMGE